MASTEHPSDLTSELKHNEVENPPHKKTVICIIRAAVHDAITNLVRGRTYDYAKLGQDIMARIAEDIEAENRAHAGNGPRLTCPEKLPPIYIAQILDASMDICMVKGPYAKNPVLSVRTDAKGYRSDLKPVLLAATQLDCTITTEGLAAVQWHLSRMCREYEQPCCKRRR